MAINTKHMPSLNLQLSSDQPPVCDYCHQLISRNQKFSGALVLSVYVILRYFKGKIMVLTVQICCMPDLTDCFVKKREKMCGFVCVCVSLSKIIM